MICAVAGVPASTAQETTSGSYVPPTNISEISAQFEADGSSTVGPLTNAIIETFAPVAPGIHISNGVSGSGGGFNRLANGETAVASVSRPIAEEEMALAEENGVNWHRFAVAYDGIAVAVSVDNTFVDSLSTEQLERIWSQDGGVYTWEDVDPAWPAEPIELYGPGTDSGTFDYFNDEILGDDTDPRADYTPSEDDNVLVQGVAGSEYALGYFGFSYYDENQDSLRAVPIDDGSGPVDPTVETIGSSEYSPLSRQLYIYVNAEMLQTSAAVQEFIRYYVAEAGSVAELVGYIPLPDNIETEQRGRVEAAISAELPPNDEDEQEVTRG